MRSLLTSVRGAGHAGEGPTRTALPPARALRQGLLNDLANPKMAAFFLSLLPQFVQPGPGSVPAFLVLGSLFCLMTFGWLSGYALLLDRARRTFDRTRVRRTLDALTGGVLLAFGLRLATAQP